MPAAQISQTNINYVEKTSHLGLYVLFAVVLNLVFHRVF